MFANVVHGGRPVVYRVHRVGLIPCRPIAERHRHAKGETASSNSDL